MGCPYEQTDRIRGDKYTTRLYAYCERNGYSA